MKPVRVFDLHYPVMSGTPSASGTLAAKKPVVYGTAFPISPGLFATAGHVVTDALSDGTPALGWIGPAGEFKAFPIVEHEVFTALDLALCSVPDLTHVDSLPLAFDRELDLLDPAYAIGFPHAVDPEWVSVVPRALRGFVVTRREMYHLPAQPPGYEVSFGAPQGMSGAPLVSHVDGSQRAYGYLVQQGVLGLGDQQTVVGVAVDITVLLSLSTTLHGTGPLATRLGQSPRSLPTPTGKRLPGGARQPETDPHGWPDDPPSGERR